MQELLLTDRDGDKVRALPESCTLDSGHVYLETSGGAYLDRRMAAELADYLGAFLEATEPCVADLQTRMPDTGQALHPSTILEDAQAAVYGDRQADYGHPREDFTRTAILWTGLLHHKLADGAHLEPEDVARCQIAVKLARDVHAPKRDNRVDMAGYALTLDRLETGR